jgi:hypothetical protein
MRISRTTRLSTMTVSALLLPHHFAHAVDPVIRRVDWQSTGTGSGLTWENAFPTLAACLEHIAGVEEQPSEGWQIWVAQGEYVPSPSDQTFPIADNIAIYGGFLGTETSRQQRNPEENETTLSGEMPFVFVSDNPGCGDPEAGPCFTAHAGVGCDQPLCCHTVCAVVPSCCNIVWDANCVAYAESFDECLSPPETMNAPSVISTSGGGDNRRVDGFTITKGGTFETDFQENGFHGGGVRVTLGSLRLVRCIVTGNRAENGGGISVDTDLEDEESMADVQVWSCRIHDNVATIRGAGVFVLGRATYVIANSEIAANACQWDPGESGATILGLGGGLFEAVTEEGFTRSIINCTVVRNTADIGTQGIYQNQFIPLFDEDLLVANCIVRNNLGLYNPFTEQPEECEEPCVTPEIVGNASIVNCLVAFDEQNPPANFIDCINAPPGLLDIEGGDYRLAENSPCIDAGENDLVLSDLLDVNDNTEDLDEDAPDRRLRKRVQPAPQQSVAVVDIGAHEYPNCICSIGDFNEDNSVNGADLGILLGAWGPCSAPCPPDLDGNGEVDGADLGILLGSWCGDREYPRDCIEDSFASGMPGVLDGPSGSESSAEQSSGMTLDELAAFLGFDDRVAFIGWLGQLPYEDMESWLGLLEE